MQGRPILIGVMLWLCAAPSAAAQGAAEDSLRALVEAARSGDAALVRLLLAAGVNPNAAVTDHRPIDPLHAAAGSQAPGSAEVIRVLVDRGASVRAP